MSERISCCTVVENEQKEILLGIRKGNFRPGERCLPGGKLEDREELKKAAARELTEESSLVARELHFLGVVRELEEGKSTYVHFAFLCKDFEGTPRIVEPESCDGWEWFDPKDLPTNVVPYHRAVIDMYVNADSERLRDLIY